MAWCPASFLLLAYLARSSAYLARFAAAPLPHLLHPPVLRTGSGCWHLQQDEAAILSCRFTPPHGGVVLLPALTAWTDTNLTPGCIPVTLLGTRRVGGDASGAVLRPTPLPCHPVALLLIVLSRPSCTSGALLAQPKHWCPAIHGGTAQTSTGWLRAPGTPAGGTPAGPCRPPAE